MCQTGPAAQPGGSVPVGVPVGTVTGYNVWQQPTTVLEKDSSGNLLRTTTTGYDSAGRVTTSSVVTTGSVAGAGTNAGAVPTTTTAYDPATGLLTSVSSSTGTISTGYDTLGRSVSYTDASGNASTTTYDVAGRIATRTDGKGTYTYTYDGLSGEHRGLLTKVDTGLSNVDPKYASNTAYSVTAFDADGSVVSTTLPNGDVAASTFDNAGEQTQLAYSGAGLSGLSFSAVYDAVGRKVSVSGPVSSKAFTYTDTGELATAVRNVGGACTSQGFGYDSDSNRTGYASASTCAAPAPTPGVHTYDAADRLTDPGIVYDQLGRTTTSPAGTVTGGASVTVGYFDNDMVQQQSQTVGGVTHTQAFTLDPSGHRILTQNDSVNGLSTNYYGDSGDSPAWTSTSSGFTRNIAGLAGLGAIQTHSNAAPSNADTVALQLTDLTGSVIATVDDVAGATPPAVYDYDPFGSAVGGAPAPARYGWLGKQQRAADDLGGLVLMGYRLYNPTTGRFLQTDPVQGGSANDYDYAMQDPINNFDLDGRMCWSWGSCKKAVSGYVHKAVSSAAGFVSKTAAGWASGVERDALYFTSFGVALKGTARIARLGSRSLGFIAAGVGQGVSDIWEHGLSWGQRAGRIALAGAIGVGAVVGAAALCGTGVGCAIVAGFVINYAARRTMSHYNVGRRMGLGDDF